MKLSDIESKLSKLPTIMDISDEMALIKDLMNMQLNNFDKEILLKIISAIELTHTDNGVMELDHENECIFKDFSDWLIRLNQKYDFNINQNTIENFALTVEDVKRLML